MMKEQLSPIKKGWDFLQVCYALLGNSASLHIGKSWSREKKNRVRTGLLFFLFLYMLSVYVLNIYETHAHFRYHWLVFGLVIFLLGLVSKEKELSVCKWNSAVSGCWLVFWTLVCISDFVVSKKFRLVGWIMLFAVGFLIYVWQHMEHPKDLIRNFLQAIELLAIAGMIYNVIFRLKYDGLFYNGYMRSASDFGAFSAFLCLVFLIELYGCWQKRVYGRKMAIAVCGTAVSVLQVLLSGKKSALIYTILILVIAFIGILKGFFSLSKEAKAKLLVYGILAIGIVCMYYIGIKNVPAKLHTEIVYVKEKFETGKDPVIIETLANNGNEVYGRVQYQNWEEQVDIWKAYLKETNLFGHSKPDLEIEDKAKPSRNLFLQILYRYGMLAFVAYLLLFGTATCKVICNLGRDRKKPDSMELLTGGVLLFWWIVGSFSDLEYPYLQPVWLLVYLLMGRYFMENRQVNGRVTYETMY